MYIAERTIKLYKKILNIGIFSIFISLLYLYPPGVYANENANVVIDSIESENHIDDKLVPSRKKNGRYEIDEIKFVGNSSIPYDEIFTIISSRPSERGFIHGALQEIKELDDKNGKPLPGNIKGYMEKHLQEMESEVKYFEPYRVENDIGYIKKFYMQNGFHRTQAYYSFDADFSEKKNILTFHIIENKRSKIKSIHYIGLDSLPFEVDSRIKQAQRVKKGDYFDENNIVGEANKIHRILLDNGYYYATRKKPVLSTNINSLEDSIAIEFNPGLRQKVGHISYIDSTKGQNIIARDIEKLQMDLKAGAWFKLKDLENSVSNLTGLGAFDIVSIDTSSRFDDMNDTLLPFLVFLQYKEQKEFNGGFGLNTTEITFADDELYLMNLELGAQWRHINLGGAAQSVSIFGKLIGKDLVNKLNNGIEWEGQAGINYSQPFFFSLLGSNFGLSADIQGGINRIYNALTLYDFSTAIDFPFQLRDYTAFNYGNINFTLGYYKPKDNFDETFTAQLEKAKTELDTSKVREALLIYKTLDENDVFPSMSLVGITIAGDHRKPLVSPRKGWYFTFTGETTVWGLAQFVRGLMSLYQFNKVGSNSVIALKLRSGYTHWFGYKDFYIPYDRQFFAGGANSVRGWAPRTLRYTPGLSWFENRDDAYFINSHFIGSMGLLEGSIEYRWRFPGSKFGITSFIDFGNAYTWAILEEGTNDFKFGKGLRIDNFYKSIALAAGVGLRYELPIGPVRIDIAYPVFDPNATDAAWIFERSDALGGHYFNFHLALGHAF